MGRVIRRDSFFFLSSSAFFPRGKGRTDTEAEDDEIVFFFLPKSPFLFAQDGKLLVKS